MLLLLLFFRRLSLMCDDMNSHNLLLRVVQQVELTDQRIISIRRTLGADELGFLFFSSSIRSLNIIGTSGVQTVFYLTCHT